MRILEYPDINDLVELEEYDIDLGIGLFIYQSDIFR